MSRYAINAVGPSFYAGAGSVSPAFQPFEGGNTVSKAFAVAITFPEYRRAFAQWMPIMRDKWQGASDARVLDVAKIDVWECIVAQEREPGGIGSPSYLGKLYAELDAIRDAQMALRNTVVKRKRKPVPARKAALRCPHCGAEGERAGHQDCAYPQDMQ